MRELHDEFAAWVSAGGIGDPSRDVAVHAFGCDDCLALASALDALRRVDPAMAGPPPVRAAPLRRNDGLTRVGRLAAGAVSVVLVLGAGALVGRSVIEPRSTEAVSRISPTATPAEGVLSGQGGPEGSAAPTVEASRHPEEPSPSPTATAAATPSTMARETPRPPIGGGPLPMITAAPATPTPRLATPTPQPTVAASTAPVETPSPTAAPSSTESSEPIPSPSEATPASPES